MLKPFTAEGRFECGLDNLIQDRVWAFVAVTGEGCPARLGVAVRDEPGFYPVPEVWSYGDDLGEMQAHADALNAAEGLDLHAAALIVASSMRRRLP